MRGAGLPVMENPSHIVPVMVGDPVHCKAVTDTLLTHYGIYVQPINYPTVPRGTERMRFTPSPVHTDAEIAALIAALKALWAACPVGKGQYVRLAAEERPPRTFFPIAVRHLSNPHGDCGRHVKATLYWPDRRSGLR